MDTAKLMKYSGLFGLGLIVVGGFMYYRERKRVGGGLGLYKPGRFAEAPVIGGYSDGNMSTVLRASENMPIEERIASIQRQIEKSVQDPEMRKLAGEITRDCPERDGMCEAKRIYKAVKKRMRYTGDIAPIKIAATGKTEGIDLYQSARRTWEMGMGDCLPIGTLLLTKDFKFVKIEDLIIGQKIWGRDRWTRVEDVWFKGRLPVDVVHMNNGSSFQATGEHKVYVAICPSHPLDRPSGFCSCPISNRSVERIRVSQLEPGMVLVQPDQISFGTEEMDPRQAYVEGLYISDGYMSHVGDFDISGRDGHPKEAQKREVETICKELGFETTWFEKSIRVRNKDWASRMAQMGHRAISKHALSINLAEKAASELLRGIMADSGRNTYGLGHTFTTTSRELMLQTRVLQRMFGRSCGERYIVDHGGEGEHPIWRLQIRGDSGKAVKLLRVKEIDRAIAEKPVFDITTDDHYVYLPEADVTVSNCDDGTILAGTLLAVVGITPRLRVTAEAADAEDGHIYPVALLPKFAPSYAVALDVTLPGSNKFGVEMPAARVTDFDA